MQLPRHLTTRLFTTIVLLCLIPITGISRSHIVAQAQSSFTQPETQTPPEIVHVRHATCAKYATQNRWVPVKRNSRTGKVTPLTRLFRKKSNLLHASGKKKAAHRLKWKLTKLQRTCRTISNASQTDNSGIRVPSEEVTPSSPTTQPIDSPTPAPQSTPLVIVTTLPDIPLPPAPAGGFSFALIDACANRAVLALASEWSAQRNTMPLTYTIKANASAGIKSVRFSYKGASRMDNTLPFSLFGETETGTETDYLPGELPFGRTVIEVTGYTLPDGTGLPAATGLIAITIQPNPINQATSNLNQLPTLDLPTQLTSVDTFKLNPSGCLAVDGLNADGTNVAFELIDETQTWKTIIPTQPTDDSATLPDGYQKIATSNTTMLLTYQKEPYECNWDGLSTITHGIQTDIPSPFQGCVSIERGSNIPGTEQFVLLGTSYVYSEDSDPIASLHLARVQGNGKPAWRVRLPFVLQTSINVQNITYIPQSSTDPLITRGAVAILLSIGDDPSGPLPPAPLLPGTNVVFADANSGVVTNNQLFPANEEPLKVAGIGYDAYAVLSIKPGQGGSQVIGARIVR